MSCRSRTAGGRGGVSLIGYLPVVAAISFRVRQASSVHSAIDFELHNCPLPDRYQGPAGSSINGSVKLAGKSDYFPM